ncbi:MAG: thioredoxin [Bacteroidaceae bacterium]|nr:thioredoxin [Bacteroidaceae bacterium]MBO7588322.1 thioredoxin [Bacteroidaceae bacterium]MBP5646304.1 thioredoxin [Bacteroidaceae bacterium]
MEQEITEKNFDAVTGQGKPVMIDFWATWCGPCRRLAPVVEELAAEYDGKVIVGKCDIEENTDLTDRFGIMNVPTIVFIKDGKEVDRVVGAAAKSVFQEKLNALI